MTRQRPRFSADQARYVGGKKQHIRDRKKAIRQLELEIAGNPPAPRRNQIAEWVSVVHDSAALVAESRRAEAVRALEMEAVQPAPPALRPGDVVISTVHADIGCGPWTVVHCGCELCARGRFVAVDQLFDGSPRHIASAALRRRGECSPALAESWLRSVAYDGPVNRGLAKAESAHPRTAELLNAWISELAALDAGGGE